MNGSSYRLVMRTILFHKKIMNLKKGVRIDTATESKETRAANHDHDFPVPGCLIEPDCFLVLKLRGDNKIIKDSLG